MGNTQQQPVIVLARNYSTGLSIIRSLGKAGFPVDLIASSYKKGACNIAARSKYVGRFTEVVSGTASPADEARLMDAILSYADMYDRKPVLFPTDDYTASVVDRNRSALEAHFLIPGILGEGDGALTKRMNKLVQGELARAAGLLTPREWVIALQSEIVLPEDIVYPCFCKPLESISGHKTEMAVCGRKEDLLAHLSALREKGTDRRMLVQEYLKIDGEIDLSGVCLDQEVFLPGIIRKTKVAQYERGVTLSGRVCPLEEIGETAQQLVALLRKLHYVGMFDLELNVVGDKLYFGEINLRSGGPNYIYFKSGVNLPVVFVKGLLGMPIEPEERSIGVYGKSFVYEKVAWEDYFHGYMTRKQLNACLQSAEERLLWDAEDPAPGRSFTMKMNLIAVRETLKRSIKRI